MTHATIKDVAKYAKVSTATVSRVLNKNEKVAPEIKMKVLEAIKELNYYPNSVARGLKMATTFTIGFLVSDISNIHFTTIAKAVEDVISKEKYNVIVCSTENSKEKEMSYLKLLMSKKVDALILNTTGYNDDLIVELSHQIPIVLLEREVSKKGFKGDLITVQNFEAGYLLTKHLLEKGHRKIGIINGLLNVNTGKDRFEGYISAMNGVNIEISKDYPYIYQGDFTVESGYNGAKYLFNLKDKPTGIVIMNNEMAIGALNYFCTNSVKVPDEISIVAYGYIRNIDLMYIKPSVAFVDPIMIGRAAAMRIMELINEKGADMTNRILSYCPQFVEGSSVIGI